jgi:SAM-dependent methyltransferase
MAAADDTRRFSSQEEYFSRAGGDAYFDRNLALQSAPDRNHPALRLLGNPLPEDLSGTGRGAVLGGAGGREAAALQEIVPGWRITNLDISEKAIEFGKRTFPNLEHHCLSITSTRPPLSEVIGPQDLTMVVSVLHWVDRSMLSSSIANIDRVVVDGGLLLITDFLPSARRKNPIRGSQGFYTFKQDYAAIFLSLGTYEIERMQVRTSREPADLDREERRVVDVLLRKRLTSLYPVGWDTER